MAIAGKMAVAGLLSFFLIFTFFWNVEATTAETAAKRALEWLVNEWDEDFGWGTNTPRGLVSYQFARRTFPENSNITSMAKTLNVLAAVELLKEMVTRNMTATDVAHYVNALTATCQNPQNFHGRDLLAELRARGNEDKDAKGTMSPLIYLTLCVNGLSVPTDVHRVYRAASNREPGLLALGAMSLMCLVPESTKNVTNGWEETLSNFVNKSLSHLKTYQLPDVYATSMVLQMMRCIPKHLPRFKADRSAIDSLQRILLKEQLSNGSFGDFLSTYLAIPALLGFCPLDVKRICDERLSSIREYEVEYTSPNLLINVTYALWIDRGILDVKWDNRGIPNTKWIVRSRTYSVPRNWTLFDLMNHAKSQSSSFDFSYDEDGRGKFVYEISQIPNDSVKGLYWKLLINQVSNVYDVENVYSVQGTQPGLDTVHLTNGYSYVYMFSRGA